MRRPVPAQRLRQPFDPRVHAGGVVELGERRAWRCALSAPAEVMIPVLATANLGALLIMLLAGAWAMPWRLVWAAGGWVAHLLMLWIGYAIVLRQRGRAGVQLPRAQLRKPEGG